MDKRLAEWIHSNDYALSLGHMSSGNSVINAIVGAVADRNVLHMQRVADADFSSCLYFTGHIEWLHDIELPLSGKIIIIMRDPRDAILGTAHRLLRNQDIPVMDTLYNDRNLEYRTIAWRGYLERFYNYDHIIIQYESFCLNPEKTIMRILNFLNVKPVNNIMDIVVWKDINRDKKPHSFGSNEDRYAEHCLKWQRDSAVTTHFLDFVWLHLQYIMMRFGYTRDGHDKDLLI